MKPIFKTFDLVVKYQTGVEGSGHWTLITECYEKYVAKAYSNTFIPLCILNGANIQDL